MSYLTDCKNLQSVRLNSGKIFYHCHLSPFCERFDSTTYKLMNFIPCELIFMELFLGVINVAPKISSIYKGFFELIIKLYNPDSFMNFIPLLLIFMKLFRGNDSLPRNCHH